MNIAYFFHENDCVRVPCFNRNGLSFSQFGGVWDTVYNGYNFKPDLNPEIFRNRVDVICDIKPDENGNCMVHVHGFLEYPWECKYNPAPAKKLPDESANQCFSFPKERPLAEKLSALWISKMEEELRSRKYSLKTRNMYVYYNRLLCRSIQKIPEYIKQNDITWFLAQMEKTKNYSASSINMAISAIKFFFKYVMKSGIVNDQKRPDNNKSLPMILSKEEITKILSLEKNPKHRLLLMLVYSSGLRVSEAVALKKEHIDLSRQVIYINLGKGRKNRYTMLSERASDFIKEYYEFYGIEKWIFPGQKLNDHLSIRSAQYIFNKAVLRAGIEKNVSIHGLRHTFATHLLESGTDIRYIQSLLGHANLRTTERYTHVAKRNVLKIKSPLDDL